MFPEGGQTRKHRFLAMFPEGGQTRKHCFLAMFRESEIWLQISNISEFKQAMFLTFCQHGRQIAERLPD
jgi:hypothetical protein